MREGGALMARVFIFATVLLLIGCTSTTRLYSGGDRAAASVAKVIATDEVRIAAIDSKRVGDAHRDESPIAWTFKKVEYELPPGEHRLTIQFDKYEGTEAVGPNT